MPSLSIILAGAALLGSLTSAKMLIVKAGGNGDHDLEFHPDSITADVGDQVQFEWYPLDHSLASSTYEDVCKPDGKIFSGYFDPASGTMDVSSVEPAKRRLVVLTDMEQKNTFVINITSTDPIWYYCTQAHYTHCQNGMVGVINPPTSGPQTLAAYKAASAAAKDILDLPAPVGGMIVAATSSGMASAPSASHSAMSSAATKGTGAPFGGLVMCLLMALALL